MEYEGTNASTQAKIQLDPQSIQNNTFQLVWRKLSAYIKREYRLVWRLKKVTEIVHLINPTSGKITSGTLVAVMGGSGAGKTTFLEVLSQRYSKTVTVTGDVIIQQGQSSTSNIKGSSGFLYQDELFFGSLTVEEFLNFYGSLVLENFKHNDVRLMDIITSMGLRDCCHTQIGIPGVSKGISGGERKRVALSVQLLTNPPVLFCDEPTTGLDVNSAKTIITLLKQKAQQNNIVICTIHQPSSQIFNLFDHLVILSCGHMVYSGPTKDVLSHFEKIGYPIPAGYTIPDHILKISTPVAEDGISVTNKMENLYNVWDSIEPFFEGGFGLNVDKSLQVDATKKRKPASSFKQFCCLFKRSLIETKRNPSVLWFKFFQKLLIGLLLGIVFTGTLQGEDMIQNISGLLFSFVTENSFIPIWAVLNTFHTECVIVKREYLEGLYGHVPYFLSKVFLQICIYIADPVLFLLTCYFLVQLRSGEITFLLTAITLVLCANVACAWALIFGAFFESISLTSAIMTPLDILTMATGGLLIHIDSLPWLMRQLSYVSWYRYAFENLLVIQLRGRDDIMCGDPRLNETCSPHEVLQEYSFTEHTLDRNFVILLSMCVLFHSIAALALYKRLNR